MRHETAKRLLDARNACAEIEEFASGHTLETMRQTRGLQLILQQLIQITGESLNGAYKLEPDVVAVISNLRLVVDMRNRLIHGYDSVDYGVVWRVATDEIPGLRAQLDEILRQAPPVAEQWR